MRKISSAWSSIHAYNLAQKQRKEKGSRDPYYDRSPKVTCKIFSSSPLKIFTTTESLGLYFCMSFAKELSGVTRSPLNSRIMSPSSIPAFCAPDPEVTAELFFPPL